MYVEKSASYCIIFLDGGGGGGLINCKELINFLIPHPFFSRTYFHCFIFKVIKT